MIKADGYVLDNMDTDTTDVIYSSQLLVCYLYFIVAK